MKTKKYAILLVEDNKLDQMAFARFVKTAGHEYEYTIAESVSQAVKILESSQFDVIISDYSLGDGTALDILDSARGIPVIVVTAADAEEVAINALKAGAYDYISKDFGLDHLKRIPETIENAIKRREQKELTNRPALC